MIVSGIIAEYNPFHKGHQYHIEKTRQITGADYIIAILSPDYVQRGVPAFLDKFTRTKMALLSGVDLVIELPLAVATSSAEFFALGGISLLHQLDIVDYCSFGSELGEVEPFLEIANTLVNESPRFQSNLKTALKNGMSFPVARKKALAQELPAYTDILDSPNNILGIEYCKALKVCNSPIKPVTIKRTSDNYHEESIAGELSSAKAIRTALFANSECLTTDTFTTDNVLASIKDTLPPEAFAILRHNWLINGPLDEDDFSSLLRYKLLSETTDTLTTYIDVSANLANRIINSLNDFKSFSQFADLLKSKEMTRTRINRALLHILLNIKKIPEINYARILGFRKSAQPLLHELKKSSGIPLITKPNEVAYDTFAANLYESTLSDKFKRDFVHEYSKPVVVV